MQSIISVAEKVAFIHVYSGLGEGSHVKLIGATFSVVPIGTVVDKLSIKVPEGLHALAFFCEAKGPHWMGSRKATYLDLNLKLSSKVLLVWEDNGKIIVKADHEMKAPELSRFNPFVCSDTDISVVDADRKIAYVSDLLPRKAVDPAWTYKSVSTNVILEYITKRLTMGELDERATSEQRARDELQELQVENLGLRDLVKRLEAKVGELKNEIYSIEGWNKKLDTIHERLTKTLMKSEGFYTFLKFLPVKLRPKAFEGFFEAMGSLDKFAPDEPMTD